jgi:hypothetical protein
MTQTPKAAKQTYVQRRLVGLLLKLDLPATLSRCPPSYTLVLPDLMLKRGCQNTRSHPFHTVWFIQISVDAMQVLVIYLKIGVFPFVMILEMKDALFETFQRSRKCFALKCGLSGHFRIDFGDQPIHIVYLRLDEKFGFVCTRIVAVFLRAKSLFLL